MKIIEVKENKKQYLDLLLLADEQEDMVDRYLDNGKMYVLDDNGVKCECVITDKENDILEIKNIATVPEYQGKGYANGRMSRLLTLLLFYKAGYIVGKYVSMEMLIEKTKETYYEALQASSVGWYEGENSYEPFVKYYLGIMLKAYNEFESRVEHLKYHNLSKPDRIKAVIDNKVGKITKKEIMELCPDISKVTVERTLTDLVKSGYIAKVGAGPSTGYVRI